MEVNYVIIGNSAAAVGAVEGIRRHDGHGNITIISDESYHTYSRPLISYYLAGKVDYQRMFYRSLDFYEKNKVTPILGVKAVSIDPANKSVHLEDGRKVPYDKLLIATGSRPFVPPIPGALGEDNVFTFLTLDSSKAVKAKVRPGSKVVVLGAGLIGLKVTEGLVKYTTDITVVDLADRLLPSILDQDGAKVVQEHIEEKGVRFIFNQSAVKAEDNTLKLSGGDKLKYDLLIIAVGVRPNVELAKEAGVNVGRGIITDKTQLTNVDSIYAAGDCTESYDITAGQSRILALLPNAYMQGEVAGRNMAGFSCEYDNAIPMNAIGFFGLPMITAGSMNGECLVEKGDKYYKKLVFGGGRLIGYMIIGPVDRAGIYTSLVRERVPVADLDMELLKKAPMLAMFGKEERKRRLAGGVK